ncbi:hypothetical protein [Streptomyces sp. NPDC058773]|uniref:hypothetical protein n=1 Tax=Streptomyces sp. NPDC058773 TaxID=3346632 RepID=UPI0036C29FC9
MEMGAKGTAGNTGDGRPHGGAADGVPKSGAAGGSYGRDGVQVLYGVTGRGGGHRPLGPVWSGRTLLVSMAALLGEAALAVVGFVLYAATQEGPAGNTFLSAFALPVALVVGTLPGLVLTVTLVLPTLSLARWAARRGGVRGRPKWWWTAAAAPFTAAVAAVAYGVFFALLTDSAGPPRASLVCWPVLAVAAVPAALLAAVAARGTGARRTVRLTLTVAGGGFLAALALGALGAGLFATGLVAEYEPPEPARAALVGSWGDGSGGTLELSANGAATARGRATSADDCAATGSWELHRAHGGGQLQVEAGGCEWYVGGTEEELTLYSFVGDPDKWDRHVLTRQGG